MKGKFSKLNHDLDKIVQSARRLKAGYEFTFTWAAGDPDEFSYQEREPYMIAKEQCKQEMRDTLKLFARNQKRLPRKFREEILNSYCYCVHEDPGVIEISAPPTANVRINQKVLAILFQIATKHGFVPYRLTECGGMHTNVDLTRISRKKKQYKSFGDTRVGAKLCKAITRASSHYTHTRCRYERTYNNIYNQIQELYYSLKSHAEIVVIRDKLEKKLGRVQTKLHQFASRARQKLSDIESDYYAALDDYQSKFRSNNIQRRHAIVINKIINIFPSIAWIFHAPNDDDSGQIRTQFSNDIEYKHVAARYDDYGYTEYRCVGMIGVPQQLPLVDTFFRRLSALALQNMHLVDELYRNEQEDFNKYTVKTAVHEFYHVCRILGLNPEDYRWWYENHLVVRFGYDDEPVHTFRK